VDSEYITYFYPLGYLCAKNYQIWWRFDEVFDKNKLGHFLAHPIVNFEYDDGHGG